MPLAQKTLQHLVTLDSSFLLHYFVQMFEE
jgi:hypothetical protein